MLIGKQLHITSENAINPAVVPAQNGDLSAVIKKPAHGTGFWTSTWREKTQDSAWVEWSHGNLEDPYQTNWFLLTAQESAKLYVADTLRDLQKLFQEYKLSTPYSMLIKAIDFEKINHVYDGIWLTEQGNRETHLSYPEDLNGWDCESVLWFRWCFTEIQQIAVPESVIVEE